MLLPVLTFDFGGLLKAVVCKDLASFSSGINPSSAAGAAVGVVVAAHGYPEASSGPVPVTLASDASLDHTEVFHVSTFRDKDGSLQVRGGRRFTVVGRGAHIRAAAERAYAMAAGVRFKGAWYRRDIGRKFLEAPS